MAKSKSVYVCNECGYESAGWLGKCPVCMAWNSFFEQKITDVKNKTRRGEIGLGSSKAAEAIQLNKIVATNEHRHETGIAELDRVLGGGIVPGSLILVGGDPGIGKSTLIMQLCGEVSKKEKVLYVSGEESDSQIKLRADRLKVMSKDSEENFLLLSETSYETIEQAAENIKPNLIVIDSIQTMYADDLESVPGSVGQVREVTGRLMRLAKTTKTTVVIVGHVTKEGAIAGPRVLEHMVDTVLYFEGDRHMNYRILRAVKNRFGSTNEIGIFEMTGTGLQEVSNPSEIFISERDVSASGTVIISNIEGTRPMLIEVQALVAQSGFQMPKRTTRGFDASRLSMLIAVLDKIAGVHVGNCDIYLNIVGGLVVNEPACDVGIIMAIASSQRNKSVDSKTVFIGEVGLTGEIRNVNHIEKRITEAARLGFTTCVVPKGNCKGIEKYVSALADKGITVVEVSNVRQLLQI